MNIEKEKRAIEYLKAFEGERMRDRLIELIYDGDKEAGFYLDNRGTIDSIQEMDEIVGKIADTILADGWMRPPVKVGQTVYAVDRRSELWWKGTIHSICYTINGIDCGVLFDDGEIAIYSQDCVFTNREDAEKALRGGE